MKLRDTLELLLLSAIWGASFLLISLTVQSFPPPWVALIRTACGSAFLWTVLLVRRRSLPPRRLIVWLLLVALFNNAIPFVFFAIGERIVPSSIAAIFNATTPIWTLLLSLTFLRQKAESSTIPGVLLGFFGVILVVYSHGAASPGTSVRSYLIGIMFIALASCGYAIATILAKTKLVGLDPIGLATTQLSLACLMIIPVALLGPHPAVILRSSVLAGIVLGVFGSGLAYLLYYSLLDRISSTRVVAVTYLLPIWGLFWGAIAHESITPTAYLGVAIVILGLYLLNRKTSPKLAVPSTETCPKTLDA
ncbi:MAG: EamA/RhaT family transporter [Acidobacteriaceae bacterium]|nr:EamA/RhaT family transporter [Acidobacteriaceae bacterium]